MSTVQSAQQPNSTQGCGANGNGTNGHAPSECPTGKKQFGSKQEAEQFEAHNRNRFPKQSQQYGYKCEACAAYHLTAKPRDAYAIGPTNLKRLENLAIDDAVRSATKRKARGETEAEVKRLWERGLSDTEIASQLGITNAGVSHHRKKFGAANKRNERITPLRQAKPPLTLPEYDEQRRLLEEEYQAKLMGLEQHKQRLEEANRLSVSECQEGQAVFIRFGHNERMAVPKDKVAELTDMLMLWV
jgi:predicted transcriptional regulator